MAKVTETKLQHSEEHPGTDEDTTLENGTRYDSMTEECCRWEAHLVRSKQEVLVQGAVRPCLISSSGSTIAGKRLAETIGPHALCR